jgi:AcrR family transcriptional regulator
MRTRKEPEQRKQEIFAAAVQLFMEKGYAATTVADITKAAGVAKGTFFYYFATKDVLLEAIGRRWAEAFARRYEEAEKGTDAVERFCVFLRLFESDDPMDPLFDQLIREHQYQIMDSIWQKMLAETFEPLLRGILMQGQAEGSMHFAGSIDSTMHYFWCIFDAMYPMGGDLTELEGEELRKHLTMGHRLLESLLGLETGALGAPVDVH